MPTKTQKTIVVIYHLLFFIIVYYYTKTQTIEIDSLRFYRIANESSNWFSLFRPGSSFISFLIYPLVKLGLSYFTITFIFSLISLKGFLIFLKIVKSELKNRFFILLLFMIPSLHFWTCFISKEALVFYLMALIISDFINKKEVSLIITISMVLLLLIRPYMFFIFLIAFGFDWILNENLKRCRKVILFLFAVFIGTPFLLTFIKLETLSYDNILENYNKLILYSQNYGNSSIDLANSNYLQRLVLVLFRPFFIDVLTIQQFFVSAENLIVWSTIILNIKKIKLVNNVVFPLTVAITTILFYSIYMYNMGLASRMRVMFLPYIFICFILTKNINVKEN